MTTLGGDSRDLEPLNKLVRPKGAGAAIIHSPEYAEMVCTDPLKSTGRCPLPTGQLTKRYSMEGKGS